MIVAGPSQCGKTYFTLIYSIARRRAATRKMKQMKQQNSKDTDEFEQEDEILNEDLFAEIGGQKLQKLYQISAGDWVDVVYLVLCYLHMQILIICMSVCKSTVLTLLLLSLLAPFIHVIEVNMPYAIHNTKIF